MLTINEMKLREKQKEEQKQIKAFALQKIKLMEGDKSIEDEDERETNREEQMGRLNYKITQSGIHPNKIGNYMMQHHSELLEQLNPKS